MVNQIISFLLGILVVIIFWYLFESRLVVIKPSELENFNKFNK